MGCFKDCVVGFAKYILFFFNLIILVAAIVLIALAVKSRTGHGFDLSAVSTFSIILGVIIALIAFFGCCGAIKEDSCMLTTYIVVVSIIFIIQLALGILAFVAVKSGQPELDKQVTRTLTDYYTNYWNLTDIQEKVDDLQRSFECCGLNNYNDPDVQNRTYPGTLVVSCCSKNATLPCTTQKAFTHGCKTTLVDFVTTVIQSIGIVAILFAIVELTAAIFACCVKKHKD